MITVNEREENKMTYTDCIVESRYSVKKTTGEMKKVYESKPCERVSVLMASKNGIDLICVELNGKPIHYALYMDGFLLNKFKDIKIAKSMFNDFSAD